MRILFIHTRYKQSVGGEDITVTAEADLMASKGHTVETLFFDNADMREGVAGKVATAVNAIYNRRSAQSVSNVIERFRPDIIHIHNLFFQASPSVIIEVSKHKIPLVMTLHNYRLICANSLLLRNNQICELCVDHDFPWFGVKYKCYHDSAIESAVVGSIAAYHKWRGTWKNKVDLYITPSSFGRRKLLNSSFNVKEEKISVKHNFVIDQGTNPGQKRKDFYLFIGRLSKEKGVGVLLQAWANMPNMELWIVGTGPEQENLLKLYPSLPQVRFLGKKTRAEVISLMKECRALIFPSICYEGLPLTIIEALSTGTPVIASALGAMQDEMITHGGNGLLFDPGNPASLAKAVDDFEKLVRSGAFNLYENARETYMLHYHPDRCYEMAMDLYKDTIEKKGNKKYE